MKRHPHRIRRLGQPGLSLLEVILSLTILAVSLVALSQLVAVGTRSAANARDLTRAQLLCESKLAELSMSSVALTSQQQVQFETDPDWYYSVVVEPVGIDGLLAITVTVEQQVPTGRQPASYSLTRWMSDPAVQWPETFDELLQEDEK